MGQVFALSWLITWYGHVLKDFTTIVRLYDYFLATHPLMPVYFGAAVSLFPAISLFPVSDQPDTKYQLLKFRQAQRATLQLSFVYIQN